MFNMVTRLANTPDLMSLRTSICILLLFIMALTAVTAAPTAVIIHGEDEYGSDRTMPALAKELETRLGYETTVLTSPEDTRDLPNLESLEQADLLILFLRFREATEAQMGQLQAYFDAGKPAIAFRTTSHAFWDEKGWFPPIFGGHYKGHGGNQEGTTVVVPASALEHPIVKNVAHRFDVAFGGTYNAQPLAEFARPILFGKTRDQPAEPVAWIASPNQSQRLFYTSLGAEENFNSPHFQKLILNACEWCLSEAVADSLTNMITFSAPPDRQPEPKSKVLFAGENLTQWRHWDPSAPPKAIDIDGRADTTPGGPVYDKARWTIDGRAAIARPGYGDILTRESFTDSVYELDFLIPKEPEHLTGQFRGNSGVYIDGKWEIQIIDSYGRDGLDDKLTCGAIYGIAAPSLNACGKPGTWQNLQVAVKHVDENSANLSVWLNGHQIHDRVRVEGRTLYGFEANEDEEEEEDGEAGPPPVPLFVSTEEQGKQCAMDKDFTAIVRFRTGAHGPLFGKVSPDGEHREHDKVLYIDDEHLQYDIGYVDVIAADIEVTDEEWHTVALRQKDETVEMFLDGEKILEEAFASPDNDVSIMRVAAGADNFPDGIARRWDGLIESFQFFDQALSDQDIELTGSSEPIERAKPVLSWKGDLAEQESEMEIEDEEEGGDENEEAEESDSVLSGPLRLQADSSQVRFANVTVRPLADVDHASIITSWDDAAFKRGQKIYAGICFACHGDLQKQGSLPTSRPFWKEPFKNGKDPHSLYLTLKNGYEQMPPQPWLTPSAAYDVIHYIREEFVKANNPSEYTEITKEYLSTLPKGMGTEGKLTREQIDYARGPKYLRMDFGPMLNWTFEVAPENIAYKGIAVRLDEGLGGVSKGRHWMVYDHDTMRVAAAWSGNQFVDWKGIAFDQSHESHTSIVGDKTLVNPIGPGWAHPETGSWADPRFLGRDGKPYGPLPREWVQFKGQYIQGNKVVLKYTVGDAEVLESPSLVQGGAQPVFGRTLTIGASSHDLRLRVSPAEVAAQVLGGAASVEVVDGYQVMTVLAKDTPTKVNVLFTKAPANLTVAALLAGEVEDLTKHTTGGPAHWTEPVITQGKRGTDDDPFAIDEITYPAENPYHSWMRMGGFDFLPGGKRAAVATWLGDVWLVDGIDGDFRQHHWKRICSGLFQPLGVKVVDGMIFVTCRDQIAKLHDLNGDEEIDFVECFNNDHQVTEHFHEFAMGLQTDEAGNFYYAKSARHALTALVPHHGTLLRVSKDGSKTDILATGFRAANGVCLNPDGTYIVTDQEGHWNPKNRINYVKQGGFYGNMYGYHDITDSSDDAMEQPLCWITEAFDRSPGELLWVPDDAAWGALNGSLLNLSYGRGRVFVVPHEKMPNGQAQGGMVSLGLDFPTGIMRGRFHPNNGQLYTAGMFAWAGNKHQDGGFYRIRATGIAPNLPIRLKARRQGMQLSFSDPLDKASASIIDNYEIKVWGLRRTKSYGSEHYDERFLKVTAAAVSEDGKTVFLTIPEIAPTWCMEIKINVNDEHGNKVERVVHNTIHQLGGEK